MTKPLTLSFDLDGVVADSDSAILGTLHQAARRGDEGADLRVQLYYATRGVLLNPLEFCTAEDVWYILTGRVSSVWAITERWMKRHFPHLPDDRLVFCATPDVEEKFYCGDYIAASQTLALRKIEWACKLGVDVHFDNNPLIVARMRNVGIPAIQVGAAVSDVAECV